MDAQTQSANAIKWIEALMSNRYKQGKYKLGNEENGFCCWGLGCFIVGRKYDSEKGWDYGLNGDIGFLNETGEGRIEPHFEKIFVSSIGEEELEEAITLSVVNDELEATFPEIGQYLIDNAATNFIPEVASAIINHFKPS